MIKCFLVGGAVRDLLMGVKPKDFDFVITGMTDFDVQILVNAGFQQVGADFPVFLHPETSEEYALARLERKAGSGYNGFEVLTSPDISIEEDLKRRDFTMNSVAMQVKFDIASPLEDPTILGESLVDPYGGISDINNKVIRCTSPIAFKEDPVRVLRAARFATRYTDFSIEPETLSSMVDMTEELKFLTKERVFKELEKAASEKIFSRFFEELPDCCQQSLFGGNITVMLEKFACNAMDTLDSLNSVVERIAFALHFADCSKIRLPSEIMDVMRTMRAMEKFIYVSKADRKELIQALMKAGFVNQTNDAKMNHVLAIFDVLNNAVASQIRMFVSAMRSVDFVAEFKQRSIKNPNSNVVVDIFMEHVPT